MRLYRFTFTHYHQEISVLYLAKDDFAFLRNCIDWAHDVKLPEEALEQVTENAISLIDWFDEMASYYESFANALRDKGFDMEPNSHASWESWEISGEEVATLRRLHAINE